MDMQALETRDWEKEKTFSETRYIIYSVTVPVLLLPGKDERGVGLVPRPRHCHSNPGFEGDVQGSLATDGIIPMPRRSSS